MKIGFVSERGSGEPRIAVMPPVVERYRKAGVEVVVERRIGLHPGIADDAFTAAGAETADRPAVLIAREQEHAARYRVRRGERGQLGG